MSGDENEWNYDESDRGDGIDLEDQYVFENAANEINQMTEAVRGATSAMSTLLDRLQGRLMEFQQLQRDTNDKFTDSVDQSLDRVAASIHEIATQMEMLATMAVAVAARSFTTMARGVKETTLRLQDLDRAF